MNKIDRLLQQAHKCNIVMPYVDYDYSKLTEEELLELISEDVTEERMSEIVEPVKFMNRDPNSIRCKYQRLTEAELQEQSEFYRKIIEE